MSWEMPEGEVVLEPGDTPGHPMSPWFRDARRIRRERYAGWERSSAPRRRAAVLTITHNEPFFLPIFLRYYSRFFPAEDIHVLDHDTTDGSTERDGFVRIPVSHETFDNSWMVTTVEEHQRRLLERYDCVLVVDVDEIVAPNPRWGTLGDYLARFDEEWVNCLGYEVLHMRVTEPPLDPDRPILRQRAHWYPNDAYDKPVISSVPLRWRPGFHGRADYHFNLDPDLRLIHLHRADYDVCQQRHRKWRERTWSEQDLEHGWGTHNRVTEDAEFERWFYGDSAFSGITVVVEEIPGPWRAVV